MSGRKVRDAAEAEALLAEAASSRMARADWARSHGINPRSLNAWRLNLTRRAREAPTPKLELVEFVPSSTTGSAGAPLVVRCGPFAVEVAAGVDDDLLRQVLGVVASC